MNIYKFPMQIDIGEMKQEVELNPAWNFDRRRQRNVYEQRNTEMIPLRDGRQRRSVRLRDSEEVYDTVLVPRFPRIMHFTKWFTDLYGGECGRVAIVRLPLGEDVTRHIDVGEYYRKRDRFHLVIAGMYEYTVEDDRDIMVTGDLFYFDSQKYHSAKAIGTEDRIAIIFDVLGSNFRLMEKI